MGGRRGIAPDAAASACLADAAARWRVRRYALWWRLAAPGTSYLVEGAFVRVGAKPVVQLEVLATEQRAALARTLLAMWVKKATE